MPEPEPGGADAAAPFVAVVGAGPAGLMAAEVLSRAGLAVTVFDRMPTAGRKLLMAGRGGLNLTHSEPLPGFLARYEPPTPRLAAAIEAFPPPALRSWADGLGQETFVGSSGRVFPRSLKASPLLRAWLARLDAQGVRLRLRTEWTGWDDTGALRLRGEGGEVEALRPAATLLALGGASWPRLGSNGAWATVLAASGVAVTPLAPANCGFELAWSPPFRDRFQGTPLKPIALSFRGVTVRGEAMVTAEGIEGGAVYALSGALRRAIATEGPATATIDLRPDLAADALARRLERARPGESLANRLRKAGGLSPVAAGLLREAAGGAGLLQGAGALAALVKAAPLRLTAPRPIDRAISTAGGVAPDAMDDDFGLRALPGVFVAGEMLDWEAPTGGYLLQATFATAVAAARGILRRLGRA